MTAPTTSNPKSDPKLDVSNPPAQKLGVSATSNISNELQIIHLLYGERKGGFTVDMGKVKRFAAYIQQECVKAQTNGVTWVVGLIDRIHENAPPELDKEYKGLKNTIRDAYEVHTGIDPAPSYPVNVKLKDLNQGGEV